MRDRLSLVVNRANSAVKLEDLERAVVWRPTRRSGPVGLPLVKASNEGRTLFELAPKEKITQDFVGLADSLLGLERSRPQAAGQPVRRAVTARACPACQPRRRTTSTIVVRSSIVAAASGTGPCPAWIHAHGPRRRKIAAMPAVAAGWTSLSTRSPT